MEIKSQNDLDVNPKTEGLFSRMLHPAFAFGMLGFFAVTVGAAMFVANSQATTYSPVALSQQQKGSVLGASYGYSSIQNITLSEGWLDSWHLSFANSTTVSKGNVSLAGWAYDQDKTPTITLSLINVSTKQKYTPTISWEPSRSDVLSYIQGIIRRSPSTDKINFTAQFSNLPLGTYTVSDQKFDSSAFNLNSGAFSSPIVIDAPVAAKISNPVISSNSRQSALVAVTNSPHPDIKPDIWTFNASGSSAYISKITVGVSFVGSGALSVVPPVVSISLVDSSTGNTMSVAVSDGKAVFNGLNLPVVSSRDISFIPTYNYVGAQNLGTGTTVKLSINEFAYVSTNTGVLTDTNIPSSQLAYSNPVELVAAYPSISSNAGLIASNFGTDQQVMQFSISANNGDVNLKQVAIKPVFTQQAGEKFGSKVAIKLYSQIGLPGVVLNGSNGQIFSTLTSGTPVSLNFANNYVIHAGSTATFAITVDTSALTKAGDSFRLDLVNGDTTTGYVAAVANKWAWNDTTIKDEYFNSYLVPGLPIAGQTFVK